MVSVTLPEFQVVSLNEKLQGKEGIQAPISGQESGSLPADTSNVSILPLNVKVEDRLSSGSAGSAVVDEDGLQLVDSGDSYFPNGAYSGCVIPADGFQSEEDGGSNDGRSYFSNMFATAEQQQREGESMGWWVWS